MLWILCSFMVMYLFCLFWINLIGGFVFGLNCWLFINLVYVWFKFLCLYNFVLSSECFDIFWWFFSMVCLFLFCKSCDNIFLNLKILIVLFVMFIKFVCFGCSIVFRVVKVGSSICGNIFVGSFKFGIVVCCLLCVRCFFV